MLDVLAQGVWDRHVRAVAPQLAVAAPIEVVVQDQEIAHALQLAIGNAVVIIAHGRIEIPVRKHGEQPQDAGLDEMQAGRFQRFEESAREADGHDVAVPAQFAAPGHESQRAWLGQRLAVEIGQQRRGRTGFVEVV